MKLKVVVWSTNFVTGNDFCRTIKIIHLCSSSTSDRHQRESFQAEIFEMWFEILPIVNIIRFNSHMVGRKNPSLFDWVSQIVAAKPSCKVYENFMAGSAIINFALKKGNFFMLYLHLLQGCKRGLPAWVWGNVGWDPHPCCFLCLLPPSQKSCRQL